MSELTIQRNLISRVNVGDLLVRSAARSPRQVAIVDGDSASVLSAGQRLGQSHSARTCGAGLPARQCAGPDVHQQRGIPDYLFRLRQARTDLRADQSVLAPQRTRLCPGPRRDQGHGGRGRAARTARTRRSPMRRMWATSSSSTPPPTQPVAGRRDTRLRRSCRTPCQSGSPRPWSKTATHFPIFTPAARPRRPRASSAAISPSISNPWVWRSTRA